jgi:hypothetical protein
VTLALKYAQPAKKRSPEWNFAPDDADLDVLGRLGRQDPGMKPLSFALLADENIRPEVVATFARPGKDLVSRRSVTP